MIVGQRRDAMVGTGRRLPVLAVGAVVLVASAVLVGGCTSSAATKKGSSTATSAGASGSVAGAGSSAPASGSESIGVRSTTGTKVVPSHTAPYPTPHGPIPSPLANQSSVLATLPGSASTTCGTVGDHADLRAGSVAVGNFKSALAAYKKEYGKSEAPLINLYVIPLHAKGPKTASITLRPHRGRAHTTTSKSLENANGYTYFAFSLSVPAPGAYEMSVAVGVDRGCFDLTFAK
jgi:hypothetical protein